MSGQTQVSWLQRKWKWGVRTWHFIVAILGALVLIATFVSIVNPNFNWFGLRDGYFEVMPPVDHESLRFDERQITLVEFQQEKIKYHEPLGPNSPTGVALRHRQNSSLIRKAVFTYSTRIKTPHREQKAGDLVSIPLYFTKRQSPGARNWVKYLDPPVVVEDDDWVAVKVSIIDKTQVGWTYRGTLRLYYDDGKPIEAKNVEVDILRYPPKEEEDE